MKTIFRHIPFSFLMCIVLGTSSSLQGSLFQRLFMPYDHQPAESVIERLQEEQINNPHDPTTNYNLGVAFYKTKQFISAKNNFDFVINHDNHQLELKDKAIFNRANSGYQATLAMLPPDFQTKQVPEKTLDAAIDEVQQAIDFYTRFLLNHEDNEQAISNKRKAEELLEQLRNKKHQQQDQQNNNDNDQQDDQKNNDQQKNKDTQQDKQDKNQQNKQDKKNNQQNQKDQNNQQDQDQQENQQNEEVPPIIIIKKRTLPFR